MRQALVVVLPRRLERKRREDKCRVQAKIPVDVGSQHASDAVQTTMMAPFWRAMRLGKRHSEHEGVYDLGINRCLVEM